VADDFLHIVFVAGAAAAAEGPSAIRDAELALRKEWGGRRPYIRQAPDAASVALVMRERATGADAVEIARRLGVSLAHVRHVLASAKAPTRSRRDAAQSDDA
jgi:hypothetical protein